MIVRDPVSGLTHCIGTILAIIGTVLLLLEVSYPAKPWHIVSFSVFGVCMVLMYMASTLYHWIPLHDKGIRVLRRVDHSMIFIYIAATYTPVCLIALRGAWGWALFGAIWFFALSGIFVKVFWLQAPRWISTAIYLIMGWSVLVAIYPLYLAISGAAMAYLVAGGVLYSLGAAIYALKKPNFYKYFGFHEIFHLFVMAGSFCHFIFMYHYISAFN